MDFFVYAHRNLPNFFYHLVQALRRGERSAQTTLRRKNLGTITNHRGPILVRDRLWLKTASCCLRARFPPIILTEEPKQRPGQGLK